MSWDKIVVRLVNFTGLLSTIVTMVYGDPYDQTNFFHISDATKYTPVFLHPFSFFLLDFLCLHAVHPSLLHLVLLLFRFQLLSYFLLQYRYLLFRHQLVCRFKNTTVHIICFYVQADNLKRVLNTLDSWEGNITALYEHTSLVTKTKYDANRIM